MQLPSESQLRCPLTGKTRNFILQIYAPVFENEAAFHRTIFVFLSPNGNQVAKPGGCSAFRCQLSRENSFYSPMPPSIHDLTPPLARPSIEDPWNVANYEQSFKEGLQLEVSFGGVHLFPERNLLVSEEASETEEEDEIMELDHTSVIQNVTEKEFTEMENCVSEEQCDFLEFQDRIRKAPSQCIRYCFEDSVTPLWPNRQGAMIDQIPNCELCGAERRFEFQILPQMLNHLNIDPLDDEGYDWGTIAIYSCSKSCSLPGSPAYVPEFVFVQPM